MRLPARNQSAAVFEQCVYKSVSYGYPAVVKDYYADVFYRYGPDCLVLNISNICIGRPVVRKFDDKLSELHGQVGRIAEI